MSSPSLAERFGRVLRRAQPWEGTGIVVAISGGLDSTVLLHLLRFTPGLPHLRLVAAHVDHAMRPGSCDDACWVRGLTRAWSVPLHDVRLDPAPVTEDEARRARYAFLREVREREGADLVVTAHQADDQAETVLFRVLRGTGVAGLAGIPERRGRLWRPLLPFRRAELEAYARSVGLAWREDPSNADLRLARNALRREVLPAVEAGPAPRARDALTALARRVREEEEGWESLLPGLLEGLDARREGGVLSFDRDALLVHHPAVRARLLRALAREAGATLSEAGTRAALEFTSRSGSGRERGLSGSLVLGREFGRLVLAERRPALADVPVVIRGGVAGTGRVRVGGRSFTVAWGSEPPVGHWQELFSQGEIRFPVRVRGWVPGDRIQLAYGTKKLKKLFLEARIPASERRCLPVVADASGEILWVPDVARSLRARAVSGEEALRIVIAHAGSG